MSEKPFLSDETKKKMIKQPDIFFNYAFDAFDFIFNKLEIVEVTAKESSENILKEIKKIPIPICEKESVWRHIAIQWAVVITMFFVVIGTCVYIIRADLEKKIKPAQKQVEQVVIAKNK